MFRPDGYNASFPTKSVALMQTSVYIPYMLGYFHTTYKDELGKENIPNSKLIVLLPRLFYIALSFLVDFLMMKFCEKNNQDHSIRLVTLASSHILLIFASRTHSSSINLLLFSLLIYLVSDSITRMNDHIPLLTKYRGAKEPTEKVKYLKEIKHSDFSTIGSLHWITLIIVAGVFNDPEFFMSYAVVPLFFYMQRGISNPLVGITHFHARCFTFLAYFFLFSVPFILWDSFYYGRVTWNDILELNLSHDSFVVTPANYFVEKGYVFRSPTEAVWVFGKFLALYNVLGLVGVVSFGKDIYDLMFSSWSEKPKLGTQWTFLNASLFLPLLFLLPNRSPFDFAPLLFPLVFMHGHKIPLISRFNSKIGFSWFLLNLISIIYFGYIHQGGITSSLLDLYSQLVPIRFNTTQVDIIFSQIAAIPPIFVLAVPARWKTLVRAPTAMTEEELGIPSTLYKTVLKLDMSSKVRVFHTGVSPLPLSLLERDLSRIIQRDVRGEKEKGQEGEAQLDRVSFLLLPSSDAKDIEEQFKNIKVSHVKTYWNHVRFSLWTEDGVERSPFDIGLNLYRIERTPWKKKEVNHTSTVDKVFDQVFQFHDFFAEMFYYIVNGFSMLFATSLFFMSYLVFLT